MVVVVLLIRQARVAIDGKLTDAKIGFTASTNNVAKVSAALNCRALVVSRNEQGDGVGGGALYKNGIQVDCLSAAGAQELDLKIGIFDKDGELKEDLIDELEEVCDGFYWHRKNGDVKCLEGKIVDVFTKCMTKLGLDSEDCLEYYDVLLG